MPEQRSVTELVEAAVRGEEPAWSALVERYLPLVSSVIGRYRLSDADAQDVNQTLWLRLVEHLRDIREPRALPAWIVTTTRHEALRVLAARGRSVPVDPQIGCDLDRPDDSALDEELLQAERHHALRAGLAELRSHHRDLLLLLLTDPPLSYDQISRRLGISIGSIGPTRARALEQLRGTSALTGLLTAQSSPEVRR